MQASLTETLTVMMAVLSERTFVSISLPGNKLSMIEMVSDPAISQTLSAVLNALMRKVDSQKNERSSFVNR